MVKSNSQKSTFQKKYIFISLFLIAISSITVFYLNNTVYSPSVSTLPCNPKQHPTAPITPEKIISDKNDIHLLHAQTNGLKQPFASDSALHANIEMMLGTGILMEVKENRFYKIKELTHSHPYLIPEAVGMLNDIGYRFELKMKQHKYKNYRMVLTSLLRTQETQSKLNKRNRNATTHTAHLYATTVDISYKDFYNNDNGKMEGNYEAFITLMEVILEMRWECKLLAVREKKQSCFHITAVVCQ